MLKFVKQQLQALPQEQLTFSTVLTLIRIMVTPCVVIALAYSLWSLALCLFVVAAVTDFLDGACARLFDEQTLLGAYLDPVADKFLILSCYSAFAYIGLPSFIMPSWLVTVILIKEVLLIAGALLLIKTQGLFMIRPTWTGKAAMIAQSIAVFWILLTLLTGRVSKSGLSFLHQLVFFFVVSSFLHYVYQSLQGTRLWYLLKKSFCSCL